ncbi:hypothetical protein R6Q59_023371 [Mikania micrantha]
MTTCWMLFIALVRQLQILSVIFLILKVSNQLAQVSCANCRTMLMYPFGAPSVKCAVCHYITNVNTTNGRAPVTVSTPSSSTEMPHSLHTQTVVVENPMSVDENGKLVSNVVVGVTTDKKPN